MSARSTRAEASNRAQVVRYLANGLVAMTVHFAVLSFNLNVLEISSAGVANSVAAVVGITASFLGNRYYVFRERNESILAQAAKFATLYVATAGIHGLVLFAWTDVNGLDYRAGFVLATTLQVLLSYWGNKHLVFSR